MAEKILNTRILMKIDTLENWASSTLKLKEGELAFATLAATEGNGLTEPVVMVKIGTAEEKTFSELPWAFHAKASDVLAACKSEASLKAFVNGVIADAGIASSSAMEALAGRVTTAEGKITALEGELNTAETGLKARMTAAEGEIDALQGLVGDKSVATQIQEKIDALKLGETYAAKSLEKTVSDHVADTVAHVTTADKTKWNGALQASDIAAGSADGTIAVKGTDVAVTGLGSAAFTESTAYDAAGAAATAESNAKAYAKEYADGLAGNYDAKGAAATAESNAKAYAKDYADGLAGNYDAKGDAAQALADAKVYTDAEIEKWVGEENVATQIQGAIAGLDLENTYAAKAHKHAKADITDFDHNHEMSEVNGLADEFAKYQLAGDYATKTEAQGYANAKDEAIAAAKKAGDDAQADIDALELYVGTIPETAEATNIVAYVQEKTAGIATDTALEELTGRVADAEGAIDAIEADYLKAADKTELQGAIDALEGLVGEKGVAEQISAVTDPLAARVKTIEDDYLKAADKTELQGNIDTVSAAVERLTNGVSAEEVDGVNDLIQYVKDHGTEVTGMKADIKANSDAIDAIEKDYLKAADKTELSNAIAAEKTRAEGIEGGLDSRLQAVEAAVGETGSVATAIDDAVTEAKGYTDAEVKELADGAVATNAADIAALEGLVGDTAVATQITNAVNPVSEKVTALEGKAHEHANKTVLDGITADQVTAWDAAVQTVTAGTGLTATKTGTDVAIAFDDSVTFIFDCGDSTNV